MANFIPIVSSSPPPLDDSGDFGWDDDDGDDFGTFTGAVPAWNNTSVTGLVEPETYVPTTKTIAAELSQPAESPLDPTASSPDKNSENYSSSDLDCNCDAILTKTASLPHDHRPESLRNVTKSLQLSQDVVSFGQCKNYVNVANAQLTDSGVYSLNVSPVQQCDYNPDVNSSPLEHSECIQQSQASCFKISPTDITTVHDSENINEQTTTTNADSVKESCSVHDLIKNFDSESLTSCEYGFCNIPAEYIPIGDHVKVSEDCVQRLQTDNSNTIYLSSGNSPEETLSNDYIFNGNSIYFENLTEHQKFTNQEIIENSVDRDLEVGGDLDCYKKSWNSYQHNVDIKNENESLKSSHIACDNSIETIHPVTCDSLEESCTNIKHELFTDIPTSYAESNNIAIEVDSSSENGDKCNVAIFNQSPKDNYICPIDNASFRGNTKSEVVHLLDNGKKCVEYSDDTKQVDAIDNSELEELSKSNASTHEVCITNHVKTKFDCDNNVQVTVSEIRCSNEYGIFYTNDITLSELDNNSINDNGNKIDTEDFYDVNTGMDDKRDDNSDQSENWAAFCDFNYESYKSAPVHDDWNSFSTNDTQDNALKGCDTVSDGKPDDWAAFSGEQAVANVIAINEDKTEWTAFRDEESSTSTGNIPIKRFEEIQSQSQFQNMSKLGKLVYAVTMCFPHPMTDTETTEDKVTAMLEGDNRDKSVWDHVLGQNTTEALTYNWSKSEWNAQLFSMLHIDTKNILMSHKMAPVPVFATGHGLLEPTKGPAHPLKPNGLVEKTKSLNSDIQEDPTPAQFDWSGSGLINPLKDLESEFLGSDDTPVHKSPFHSLENMLVNLKATSSTFRMTNQTSSTFKLTNQNENMSDEARKIVPSLPDLSFMMSRVLMFPLKSDS